MEDCWLEASDRTLDELGKLGAIEAKDARKFDISSWNVRVDPMILAKKI